MLKYGIRKKEPDGEGEEGPGGEREGGEGKFADVNE